MREGIRQLSKVCLASGIILTQVSTLGAFSTTAYAITENQISDFIIKADKDQVKINENVVLTLDGIYNQDQNLEVVLPDGMKFNEQETAKLNEKNPAIGTIQMINQSVIQIERTSEGVEVGKVFLVVTGNVAGEHTITAKAQRENNEIETKGKVNVSENKKTNPKKFIQKPEVNDLAKVEENQQVEWKENPQKSTVPSQNIPVQQSSYFKDAKTDVVPGDNAFVARFTPKTKVIVSEGIRTKWENLVVDHSHKTAVVTFTNVGYYKGKPVTLKVTLRNHSSAESWTSTESYKFLYLMLGEQVNGSKSSVDMEYEFLDEEGNPFPLKTTLNYQGVNRAKYITIRNFNETIRNMYASQDSPIQYDMLDGGAYRFHSDVKQWNGDPQKLTLTTKEVTHLKMHIENRESTESEVRYLTDFFPKVETPKVDAHNQSFQVANDPNISAEFIQTVPYLNKQRYIKQLSYLFTSNEGNQYAKSKWIVENIHGKDCSNWFTFEENSDGTTKITAKPEILNNQNFYDNVYIFKQFYDFVGSETNPVDKSRLKQNNMYPIDFTVSQSVDGNTNYAKINGTTLINYMGQVQVQHINQETNQPIPNVQDTIVEGIITDPFHVDSIAIPGYQVIKNQPITGIFLPEKQMLSHLYTLVEATLEANDFSTVVGNIPADTEELKKFLLQEGKVKATELPSNTDITRQVEVVDIGGLCNQIGSYTVTLKVKNVEKTITVNVIEGNLEFISVPEKISFENIQIPSREKTVNRSSMQGEIVVSDKRENGKEWSLYVKQVKPLTSSEKDLLPDALVYTQNGVDTVLSNQNYLVHSQKSSDYQNAHINWKDSEGIRLKVKPGPNVKVNETYQGELEWTLTDTPI
ncbi:MucBP domain-containing protein [Bacillus cytotoxicus]|uniref:adhesive domain-containing protein n=1 Tax=Bacillus cereus group sp. BfR-BA-01492 TaxID=2920361 RepID=UPI001F563A12|nr:MucBP domain-containing protein [Bacillus cereus group sp. BfR-BA-01492]EMA6344135.1 WxL domain-containing protein [Bacillus cytotoxicus]